MDPEHLPRNLRCGHVCCTKCLKNLLAKQDVIECFVCGCKQAVDSLDQLALSKGVLDVISKTREEQQRRKSCENTIEEAILERSALHGSFLSLHSQEVMQQCVPQISEGLCLEHGYYRVFYCESCRVWVCRDCTITEHPPVRCMVKSATRGLDSMKEQANQFMEEKITQYKNEVKELEEFTEMLEEHTHVFRDTVNKIFKTLEKKKCAKVTITHTIDQLKANLKQLDEAKEIQEVREMVARFEESKEGDDELDEEGRGGDGDGAVTNHGDGNEQDNDDDEEDEETQDNTKEDLCQRYGH